MLDFKKLDWSKLSQIIIVIFGAVILIMAIFWLGMFTGFRKASFSCRWGENYGRLFGGPTPMMQPRGFERRDRVDGDDFINANNASGVVIKVDGNTLLVKGEDNIEKSIAIASSTTLMKGRQPISLSDIKTDDVVVVIGTPSTSGQIEAKFVRIFNK